MNTVTSFVLRHKVAVVVAWLIVAVVGVMNLSATTKRLTVNASMPGEPGFRADARIQALYHNGGDATPIVVTVTLPSGVSANAPQVRPELRRVFAAAAGVVPGAREADVTNTADAKLVSRDSAVAFGLVFTGDAGVPGTPDPAPRVAAAAAAAAPAGWRTGVTGLTQLEAGNGSAARKGIGLATEAAIGGLGALVVLLFVFASPLAVLPMLMAGVAVPSTFLLVDGLTHLTQVSLLVEFLIALIGLGVAIDYSLLVVTRWREERDRGADNTAAVRNAMGSAGHAVLFSGLTVGCSLLALLVLPVPFLRTMGVAGFFIPLVSVAVAVTLLPVVLATVGPRLDRPRLRHEARASRAWSAWARLVLRYRRTATVVGGAVLIALIAPVFGIRLGEPATSALAQRGPAHTALADLTGHGVPSGVLTPIEVLTRPQDARAVVASATRVPGVFSAVAPSAFRADGTAIVDVLPVAEPSSPSGAATVRSVRSLLAHDPRVLGVGGAGAAQADFVHAVYGSFPLLLIVIGVVTFLLLARAFRSVVLAAKAVVFNLLSVAAAYGVMTLVWQHGFGSSAIWGIPAAGSLTIWVPVMVFAFLFGLSMDYEVFILTRMREEYDATGDTGRAVVTGIGRTGRLVTSAALILFLGFVSMASAPNTDVKVLATGLGAGILLDAVVVRCLLVPALVGVLGPWNWWLPRPLARVLRIRPDVPRPAPAPAPALVSS